MRGKRAKAIRRLAVQMIMDQYTPEEIMETYNTYNQARNCTGWVPSYDKDGNILRDGDGVPLIQLSHELPGTITVGFMPRAAYQGFKRRLKHDRKFSTAGSCSRLTRKQRRAFAEHRKIKALKAKSGDGADGSGGGEGTS